MENAITTLLPGFTVGTNAYMSVPEVVGRDVRAVVIGGERSTRAFKARLTPEVKSLIVGFAWYGGDSNMENVEALMVDDVVTGADVIFGVGGGHAVDTAKIVADRLRKPFYAFPTLASNCAASTALAVVYHADGTFCDYYYPKMPAFHVFVDTQVVAESPDDLLWAGIGDALSKEFEVRLATRGLQLDYNPMLGLALSSAVGQPLMECGFRALRDCRAKQATSDLESVALDIIVTTGLISNLTVEGAEGYYYNSSLAHAFYYGTTVVKSCEGHLHGEIVALGNLYLLKYDGQEDQLRHTIAFNRRMGFPTRLVDVGLTTDDLLAIAQKASTVREWTCVPYPMDEDRFIRAILAAEAMDA